MRDSQLDGQYEQVLGQPVSMSNHPEQWTVGTSKTPRVSESRRYEGRGRIMAKRLGKDLTARFGRGFAWRNLFRMRNFYLGWEILPTPSAILEARVKLPEELPESAGEAPRPESGALAIRQTPSAEFSHADAGRMNLYLNYAQQHLTEPRENDPVGISPCSGKDDAVVEYATGGINARVFASKYLTQLPDAETLRKEIETTRRALLDHRQLHPPADSQ
ncbi:MAG: PDDEXK nuclease domain-containing protein [Thermoguttaceae bacterium]|jgi:hypothetical protein